MSAILSVRLKELPEDIDAIPWDQLKDAYGPSVKTPGHLKKLLSSSADERQDAFDELTYTIYHQGSVYEASLYAIAPLAAMLKREEVPDPAMILELLMLLGTGSGWHTAHQHFTIVQQAFPKETRDAEIQKEYDIGLAIHNALARSLDLFVARLRAPDETVRMRAANLLALFPEKAASLTGPLQEVLDRDGSARVRTNALIVLETLQPETSASTAEKVFRSADDALLKTAAAIRWARLKSAGAPAEAVEWLAGVVESRGEQMQREYGELPASPDFWFDASNVFALAGPAVVRRVLPHYTQVVSRNKYNIDGAAALMLLALFADGKLVDVKTATLTPEQKKAILAVAQGVWQENQTYANMADVLRRFKLPERQEDMDRLLGLPNAEHPGFAGPRDRAIAEWQKKRKP
jgi:hypothetical protein